MKRHRFEIKRASVRNLTVSLISLFLTLIIVLQLFPIIHKDMNTVEAAVVDITNPDVTNHNIWEPVFYTTDPSQDQQTGGANVSQDIVGGYDHDHTQCSGDCPYYASCFIAFGEGNEVAVCLRVNAHDGKVASPEFKNFGYIGFDVGLAGRVDFFIGAYNPTGNNGSIGIYLADPKLPNTGPNNTNITKPIATFKPVAGVNYSFVMASDGSNFSGTPDYFLTFRLDLDIINNALSEAYKNGLISAELPPLTPNTAFCYVIGTATQNNDLNADVNGQDKINEKPWPISPPTSTTGMDIYSVKFFINDVLANGTPIAGGSPRALIRTDSYIDLEKKGTPFLTANTLNTPPYTVKRGYRLIGWYSDPDPTQSGVWYSNLSTLYDAWLKATVDDRPDEYDPNTYKDTYSVKFYPVWEKISDEEQLETDFIKVRFEGNGGSWNNPPLVANEYDKDPGVITHRHIDEDRITNNITNPGGPTTLPAPAGNGDTVSFLGWSYSLVPKISVTTGQVTIPTVNFWDGTRNSLDEAYAKGLVQKDNVTGEYILYAVIANYAKQLSYNADFYTGNGSNTADGVHILHTQFQNSGNAVILPTPPIPLLPGYKFTGWKVTKTDSKNVVTTENVTYNASTGLYSTDATNSGCVSTAGILVYGANVTYKFVAQWTKIPYAVYFAPNSMDWDFNSVFEDIQYFHGSDWHYDYTMLVNTNNTFNLAAVSVPTLMGYDFAGWALRQDGYGVFYANAKGQALGVDCIPLASATAVEYNFNKVTDGNMPQPGLPTVSGYLTYYPIWIKKTLDQEDVKIFFHANGNNTYPINMDARGNVVDDAAFPSVLEEAWNPSMGGDYSYLYVMDFELNEFGYMINPATYNGVKEFYTIPMWRDSTGFDTYTFLGWSFLPNATVPDFTSSPIGIVWESPDGQDIHLYAVWRLNKRINVIYHTNGGYWPDGTDQNETVPTNNGIVAWIPYMDIRATDPSRDDFKPTRWGKDKNNADFKYVFVGWNTMPDGSGVWFNSREEVLETIHVYAIWENPKLTVDDVQVIFVKNDGSGYIYPEMVFYEGKGQSFEANGGVAPDPSVPLGYKFYGWYNEPDCLTEFDSGALLNRKSTYVYGKWKLTVKFSLNGVEGEPPETQNLSAAERAVNPIPSYDIGAIETREGLVFLGWFTTPTPNTSGHPLCKDEYGNIINEDPQFPYASYPWMYYDDELPEDFPWDFTEPVFAPMVLYAVWDKPSEEMPVPQPLDPVGTLFTFIKLGEIDKSSPVPLMGAKFSVSLGGTVIDTYESDEYGVVTLGLDGDGVYQLKETFAPAGYKQSTDKWEIEVEDNAVKSTEVNNVTWDDVSGVYYILNLLKGEDPEPVFAEFKFIKVSAIRYDTVLQGAKFTLTDGDSYNKTVTSGSDGKVDFGELEDGVYTLTEITSPGGYKCPIGGWTVEIENGAIKSIVADSVNKPPAFVAKNNASNPHGEILLPNYPDTVLPLTGHSSGLIVIVTGVTLMSAALIGFAVLQNRKKHDNNGLMTVL